MSNLILEALLAIENKKLMDFPGAITISKKNKSYSRSVIDQYLTKYLTETTGEKNLKQYLSEHKIILRTVPISSGLVPLESLRLVDCKLIELVDEIWESSILKKNLNKIIIIPLFVSDRNLGQFYRVIGKSFIWNISKEDQKNIQSEWSQFNTLANKGAIPNVRGQINKHLNFPSAKDTKFIHMRPHSTKGKFELDKFGNSVRKMAFFLNPGYLRKLIIQNRECLL